MPSDPPAFENAKNCAFCKTTFGIVKRKHHCRNCGKTCCDKCSGQSLPLPEFGLTTAVRVCDKCVVVLKEKESQATKSATTTPKAAAAAAPVEEEAFVAPVVETKTVTECKCGMPLCICAPDEEEEEAKPVAQEEKPKPKAAPAAAPTSTFMGFGSSSTKKWNLKGNLNEQCRDAVKSNDIAGVRTLLDAKADPKYVDSTGNTLVHLAAMFDKFDLVTELVSRGADVSTKNPAGESPIDLAPISLQNKMKAMKI